MSQKLRGLRVFVDCGQIECKSLTEQQAFEPEAFEEPSKNRVKSVARCNE